MFFAYSCPFVSIRGSPSSPSLVFFCAFSAFCGSNTAWTTFLHIRVHSWFSLFPLLRVFSCFSCFSWFKHCLDHVFFAYSCPFVSIRGSPSSPSFVLFRVFRVFRGSNTAWTTFLYIRVHSYPFVVQASIWTTFVSIRVHSWFSLFPLLRVFRAFLAFCGSNTAWTTLFCIFVSIRVHSWFKPVFGLHLCPFVSIRGSPSPPPRVFRGSNTAWTTFLYIRVHSCPFVVLPLHPPSCFSCISCFSWFDSPFPLLPICPFFTLFKEIDVK